MIHPDIKRRVETKLQECITIAENHWKTTFKFPHVSYTLTGRTAGRATFQEWKIKLNAVLLNENVDQFIERTVPHEMAHLIDYQLNPSVVITKPGSKNSFHGPTWKRIMHVLGADSSRCHSFDTTHSRRHVTKHIWECTHEGCCGKLTLGPKRHKVMLQGKGRGFYRPELGCLTSHVYKYIGPTKPPVVTVAPSSLAAAAPGGSKMDKCRRVFDSSLPRAANIAMFQALGCSPAGASTYYQNIKKERGL